ncbi:hypothetical protein ACN4EK_13160 [Pantanalinema rosaneae CENA516]
MERAERGALLQFAKRLHVYGAIEQLAKRLYTTGESKRAVWIAEVEG